MSIVYLTFEHVIAIHEAVLEAHGGKAGFQSPELVESAVEMPKSAFGGVDLYPGLLDKASAYLFFIASNHGFSDGNKRAALASALTFLSLYGQDVEIPVNRWEELEALILAIAGGQFQRDEVTVQFKDFLSSLRAQDDVR